MKTLMMAGVVAMLVVTAVVAADPQEGAKVENPREKQMEKVGALRGRVMLKMQELQKRSYSGGNGGQAAYNRISSLQNKIQQNISKMMRDEMAKPQEMRNQAVMDGLTKRQQQVQEMYQEFHQTKWQEMNERFQEPSRAIQSLNQLFQSVANQETAWLDSGIDLELLYSILTALDKRLDEVKAASEAPLEELKKIVATWEALAKE